MSRSNLKKWAVLFAFCSPATFVATEALAGPEACGKFDFTGGVSCKIETKGGCQAQCTPLSFKAGCSGGCTATAMGSCVDSCGVSCVAECDPAALDCFVGCHAECDQPQTDLCNQKNPGEDCVNVAKAQCDMHCETACEVPPSDCKEHCTSCCTGSCTTQINYDCDYDCFAELSGGCEVQCEEPSGALFCNGQYIGADDVEACISYLATQGITVDVSARGEVKCDLSGCDGTGSGSAGFCSFTPAGSELAFGGVGFACVGLAVGLAFRRRRANKKS